MLAALLAANPSRCTTQRDPATNDGPGTAGTAANGRTGQRPVRRWMSVTS
jgi:hypothetical protein